MMGEKKAKMWKVAEFLNRHPRWGDAYNGQGSTVARVNREGRR
jgi:hypothetical protein